MFEIAPDSGDLSTLLAVLPEREAVALLSSLLDTLPVGVALYDASDDDFRVVYLNPASLLMAEPSPNVLGLPFSEAFPSPELNHVRDLFRRVRDSKKPWHEPEFRTRSGRVWDIQVLPVIAARGSVAHLMVVGQETTDKALANQQVRMAFELALALGSTLEPGEVIRRLLERVAAGLQVDRATLSRITGDEILVEAAWDGAGEPSWIGHRYSTDYLDRQPLVKQALESRKLVLGDRLNIEGAAEELKSTLEAVRHTAILPLVLGEEELAMLVLSRRGDRPFTADETGSMELIASVATAGLRNAGLFAEAEAARDRADILARQLQLGLDVAVDLAEPLEPGEVTGRLLRRAMAALGTDRATMFRVDHDHVVVEASHAIVGPTLRVGRRWRIADDPGLLSAIRDRVPATGGPGSPSTVAGTIHESRHFIVVPLILHGEVMAVLGVSRAEGRPFSADDAATLQLVGTAAAMRIRNARLLQEATEAGRVRTEFLNLAAHELRTPYTVINGYLAMLHEGVLGPAPDNWHEALRVLNLKSRELGTLIDRLLLASRLESGEMRMSPAVTDLCEVVARAVRRAKPRADLLQADFDHDLPDSPVLIDADPEVLGRVLDNLIDNALSYGGLRPTVRVGIRVEPDAVEISVEDDGPGIPADQRDRIFDRFYRIDEHVFGAPSGTGLGLYIARRLAQQSGGSVVLDDTKEGAGSRFLFRLHSRHAPSLDT